ncbi:MAG: nitrile hydratase subunit alpha [Candidatus Dormibacteraeota bacterium]|uniref:Nitrile hydratase subunit alpha n=1 Tax=Candidatus Aeolococcus gillhamiae TaxID=3127015 RepID=A0A2W6A0L2_9BACT|nr:nitrile hydratase subunit alpha [Candidatus Dormibacteraeota bacterium]PZR79048.1 MAG: nitrile hydratase subunit alpha [Candidatus Dormibacter sp. RRmetagenome_bin12]
MSGDHSSTAISERVRRVEALLEERGMVTRADIDGRIDEFLRGATPANGARIIARAWVDPAFKERLLNDANAAIQELGFTMSGGIQEQRLKVVANSEAEHNVVVCTLCSCYPIALLGPSPGWYKSEAYRSRVVREPRALLREFGLELPADTRISVWDASAESRYMVVPQRPPAAQRMSEAKLATLVTRKGLIGTAAL